MADFVVQGFNTFQAVTPDDVVDFPLYALRKLTTDAIYVGTGGDVAAVAESGIATVFPAVPSGAVLQIALRRINNASTTAQNIVALYNA